MLSDPKTKGIQMSQVHTLQMGRLVAAGSKNNLASAIDSLAGLEARLRRGDPGACESASKLFWRSR